MLTGGELFADGASVHPGEASASASQAERQWAGALPGRRAPLSLGPRGPDAAMGQLFPSGRPSSV